ncbi:LptF/LptG family permease [bacterium]|nr:LptF/LptG family permease [bacterium]
MGKLDRYILREMIAPFFISISLIMLLFTLNLLFRTLHRIVGQGLSVLIIGEYFFLNLAWIITLAVPMSMLVASLMAFGRMAGDKEIISMKASGISLARMIRPVLIMAFVVGSFSLYFQDDILPDMNHRNKLLTRSIRKKRPNIAIREGIFTRELQQQTMLVKDVNEETGMLHDVSLFDESSPKETSTIVADSGKLVYVDTLAAYHFLLYDGEIHRMKREDPDSYERIEFEEALFRIDAPELLLRRQEEGYRGDRELDLAGLLQRVETLRQREPNEQTQRRINKYLVEYHKKFTIAFASIVFVLVGTPLGVKLSRGGLGVAGPLAVAFFLLYWTFLIGGEDMADRGLVAPAPAMWAPNVILGILGILMIRQEMRAHREIRLPRFGRKKEETAKSGERLQPLLHADRQELIDELKDETVPPLEEDSEDEQRSS